MTNIIIMLKKRKSIDNMIKVLQYAKEEVGNRQYSNIMIEFIEPISSVEVS